MALEACPAEHNVVLSSMPPCHLSDGSYCLLRQPRGCNLLQWMAYVSSVRVHRASQVSRHHKSAVFVVQQYCYEHMLH